VRGGRFAARVFALAMALVLQSALSLDAAITPNGAGALPVTLDGKALGAIGLIRPGEAPLIQIEPLATALQWHVTTTAAGTELDDGTGKRLVRAGSRSVHEDGTDVEIFEDVPVVRSGHIALVFSDALAFFNLSGAYNATSITLTGSAVSQSSGFSASEIAKTVVASPTPAPVVTAAPVVGSPFEPGLADISLSLDSDGSQRFYRVGLASNTSVLHANVNAAGIQTLGSPDGTITIGGPARNASVGQLPDPVGGIILPGNGFEGATWFSRTARYAMTLIGGRRDDGRTMVGIERSSPNSSDNTTVAIISNNGAYEQTVLRHSHAYAEKWGSLIEEWLASERGFGAGLSAQTRGRAFLASTLTFVTDGLPIGPNSAPISIAAGYNASVATTFTSGFYAARGTPLSPYIGIQTGSPTIRLFANATPHLISTGLSYFGPLGNAQLLAEPANERLIEFQSQLRVHDLEADILIANQTTSSQADVELQTIHPGINLIGGFASISGGHSGPVVGISVPFSRSFAIEVSERPGSVGRYATRFSIHAGLPPRRSRVPRYPLTVTVDGVGATTPLRLLVDGVPVGQFTGAIRQTSVTLSRGPHDLYAETLDGASGSPSRHISLTEATTENLTLYPERVIRGRIRFSGAAAAIPPDASLAGIKLRIEPGGIVAEADADGNFLFPRQPLEPQAVLTVDPDTLPRGIDAPDPLLVGATGAPIDLPLLPRRVERQVFR
jgi:hypothetical protein